MKRCDCERGGDCNKVSLCALTNAAEEKDEEIERLRAALERIGDMPIGRGLDPAAREALKLCAEIAREALQEGEK